MTLSIDNTRMAGYLFGPPLIDRLSDVETLTTCWILTFGPSLMKDF